jgi:hypothetical protein
MSGWEALVSPARNTARQLSSDLGDTTCRSAELLECNRSSGSSGSSAPTTAELSCRIQDERVSFLERNKAMSAMSEKHERAGARTAARWPFWRRPSSPSVAVASVTVTSPDDALSSPRSYLARGESSHAEGSARLRAAEATSGPLERQARPCARVHFDEVHAPGSGECSPCSSAGCSTAELNGLMWSDNTPTPERYLAMSLLCDKRERRSRLSSPEYASAHASAPPSACASAAMSPTRLRAT